MNSFSAFILDNNKHRHNETAVVDMNGSRITTWDELRVQVYKVCDYARSTGLKGSIPVYMDRSAEAIATVLGLNLAGVGVAPLTITMPEDRCANISGQLGNDIWTIDTYNKAMQQDAKELDVAALDEESWSVMSCETKSQYDDRPAYLVFTSGTTGNPKGVSIGNDAMKAMILRIADARMYDLSENDKVLQSTSFSFIAFALDAITALYVGNECHILPEDSRGDTGRICEYVERTGITKMFMPPQLYRNMDYVPDSIERILLGSDKVFNIAPKGNHSIIGAYGMSETAGPVYAYEITEADKNSRIGTPMYDTKEYVLDEEGKLADKGELCLSGPLADGYFHMPELTEKMFTANPFSDEPGHKILLHTGDIVERAEDGGLLYINRSDNMFKINGQRVESGEIELCMMNYDGIDTAVVKGFTDDEGRGVLCSYYTCAEGVDSIDEEDLRKYLETKLAHYMVPTFYVKLDKFPLNANGKLNRKALELPDASTFRSAYEAPKNKIEEAICQGFEKALNIDNVGVKDDFFRMGGDSIRALSVVKECESLGLSTSDILTGRTPRGIAVLLENKGTDLYSNLETADSAQLTDSQMGVYLECMLDTESTMYNIPISIEIDKPADIDANATVCRINNVIKLHPALYSHIEEKDEAVYMVRDEFPEAGIVVLKDKLTDSRQFAKAFDLNKGPLCRIELAIDDRLHILMDTHHIVSDGTSVSLLVKQIKEAVAGMEPQAEAVDAFSLYEIEQRQLASKAYEAACDYYDKLLSGVETDSNIVPDNKPAEDGSHPAATYSVKLDVPGLREELKKTDITGNSLFMAAFGYTLAKMTAQEDSLFTAGENGRGTSLLDNTVSMIVRTLPVVMHIDETRSLKDIAKDVQAQFFKSMSHDSVSFGELCRKYGISADVAFVYQSDMFEGCEIIDVDQAFDNLNAMVFKKGEDFVINIKYRSDKYNEASIRRFAELYTKALESFVKDTELKDIELVSEEDKQLIAGFNATDAEGYDEKTIVDRFRNMAAEHPDNTALVYKDNSYTYTELDKLTDNLAAYINGQGVGTEQVVSVIIPRNEYMVIASLGIMKAGAIYEPMDPSYPRERLTLMHTDADAKLVIADRSMRDLLPDYKGQVLYTDEIAKLPATDAESLNACKPAPEDTFVLLYTSGTTGTPKGVRLSHANIISFAHAHALQLRLEETSKAASYASYGFDATLADFYPTLSVGAQIHVIPDDIRFDFPALKDYFENKGVTHVLMTTQVARQFILEYDEVKGMQCISTGGESLTAVGPAANYRVLNLYGPSETTVCVCGYELDKYYDNVPIGKAMENCKLNVVDKYGRELPIGVPGELIIGGKQVGKGYLNRAQKTAEVFVKDIYKTGDIVRYLESGDIEFIGRRDLQVKIRGFRIELSEVEQVIREYPGISDATVIAVDEKQGKSIHAYFVAKDTVDIADLNKFIKERKPAYMVPAASMQIDAMPLTPNHKVDKRKLPPIVVAADKSAGSSKKSLNSIEESIMAMLVDIVGEGEYGVETLFTDAGITSITSIKLSSQIYKKYGVSISSKELLDDSNILTVENKIIQELTAGRTEEKKEKSERKMLQKYPLTQTQMGIYLDSLRAGMDAYNIPVMFKLPDNIDIPRYKDAVITAVKAHPSMLCHIYADDMGDISIYPVIDMDIEIHDEQIAEMPPCETHFEFGQQPLFNIRIIECNGDKYICLEAHHIIADGESMTVLVQDIDAAYRGEDVESEKYTAYDYALDEQVAREGKGLRQAKEFYDSVFTGVSTDYLPVADMRGDTIPGSLNYPINCKPDSVRQFCEAHNITENTFFTAVFAMTIAKYTANEDSLFTTIYNGRNDPRTERLVSMLVKTLPIYIEAEPETSIDEFVQTLDKRIGLIKKHDVFSFADAAKEYGVKADVMFIYQGKMMQSVQLDGNELESYELSAEGLKAEFSVEVFEEENSYRAGIGYNAGHYSDAWVESFGDAFETCVLSFIEADKLADINICSEKAMSKFDSFNDTYVDVRYRPAYKMIEEQAEKNPSKLAVVASPEDPDKLLDSNGNHVYEELTYEQFNNMTSNLAHQLIAAGIEPKSPVAVMTYRSKEIYVGQIGILKAGCPFIFVSPAYPDERVSFIREDSGFKAIVTTHAVAEAKKDILAELNVPVFYADDIDINCKDESPNLEVDPDDTVYMIYTSGTTGKPKGVIVLNKGLVNIADDNPLNTQLVNFLSDVCIATLAFTFDASLLDGFCALANGMTVCIATDEEIHNPAEFGRLCLERHAQSFIGTPSFLMSLLDVPNAEEIIKQIKAMICGGESFPPALYEKLHQLNPELKITNAYGPSECTVACTAQPVTSAENITIGKPLNNYKIYIIDKQKHIMPMGALGELTILGIGVGGGYLNRPEKNAETFIEINGERAYRSGDLALITHNEDIEFHGRLDNQVKLRGLRIELGEIENQINACPDVRSSVAVVKGKENRQYLAAYYTADRAIDPQEITDRISKSLAEYMVPRIIIQLDEMPMTAHGKINRKALPEPVLEMAEREYVAPSNETEEKLCEAFANALDLEKVGVTEDFFELGGSSITATKVAMYAMSHNINIVYKDIFNSPTVRELAVIAGASATPTEETLEEDRKIDYSKTETALKGNVRSFEPINSKPLGNVLLTGATGFLGMHILKELIDNEEGNIYCLLRKGEFTSPDIKLMGMYIYYFDDTIEDYIGSRVHCIEGDITDPGLADKLKGIQFDTLINCAAIVKHFANSDVLHKANVEGVKNLVNICKNKGVKLVQVSTISVAGEGVNGEPPRDKKIKENELYFGQLLDNEYILTKFLAEKAVLDAVADGLDAKIMRAGNLMPRHSDGEFQINQLTNGFMRRLKGYYALGCIPYSALVSEMEFSPIDETAASILALAKTDSRYTVFHTHNNHKVFMHDVIRCMNAAGLKIDCVDDAVFATKLQETLANDKNNDAVGGLIAYVERADGTEKYFIDNDNEFTADVMNRIGSYWNITDDAYMINAFKMIKSLGFFDLDL